MSDPLTLGFDTSLGHCGAALIQGDACLGAAYEDMEKGQAERLMPMLEEVLAEGGADWGDLSRIGVGIGPGNFTGIRISVAAARGLALGLKIPAIGVSLLDALAFGTDGPRLASIDARRDQLYLQGFGGAAPDTPGLYPFDAIAGFGQPGLITLGNRAGEIAETLGATHRPAAFAPASAIARIAAKKAVRADERPAPLYLRAPDAAPPRQAAPDIVP